MTVRNMEAGSDSKYNEMRGRDDRTKEEVGRKKRAAGEMVENFLKDI